MTRTQDRLADALAAAARRIPDETLRPLIAPPPRRRRAAWLAPAAAAAAVMLAVGLAMAVSSRLSGSGQGGPPALSGLGPAIAPLRYYVEADINGEKTLVRSTATGAVTATVPVPNVINSGGDPTVAAASNGTFFVASFEWGGGGERIYRFRLTGAGKVAGFSLVPGGVLGAGQQVDAMAASPDGSQLAVGISFFVPNPDPNKTYPPEPSDEITVLHAATGVKTVWRGGASGLGRTFGVANLSWTGDGRRLVFLGRSCEQAGPGDSETCLSGPRTAEVRTLDPSSGGGTLDSGQLLLAQSARFPYIAQALISPDGLTITAVVLTGPVFGTRQIGGAVPDYLKVAQISVATGRELAVLYRRTLGPTDATNTVPDFLALSQDGAGQHWLLNGGICSSHCQGGFNGWVDNGRLIPVQPADGRIASEAW
jgi:hypothetical protein